MFNLESYMWMSTNKGQANAGKLKSILGIIYLCQVSVDLAFI